MPAGYIKGITIEIDGETKGLDAALKKINTTTRSLQVLCFLLSHITNFALCMMALLIIGFIVWVRSKLQ